MIDALINRWMLILLNVWSLNSDMGLWSQWASFVTFSLDASDQPEASSAFSWHLAGNALSLLPSTGYLQHIFNSSTLKKKNPAAALLSVGWRFQGWFTSDHTPVSDDIQGLTAYEKHLPWRHGQGVAWGTQHTWMQEAQHFLCPLIF